MARGSAAATATVTLAVFAVALWSGEILAAIPGYAETVAGWPAIARRLLQPVRWLLLVAAGCAIVGVRWRDIPRELGLLAPPRAIVAAIGFAALCSVPMLALGIASGVSPSADAVDLCLLAGVYPFAEEVLFRGYAFGLLVRRSRWPVWWAMVATGAVFGAVHLLNREVQVHDLAGQLLSIGLIAVGGAAFAWLYHRWRYNLWIAFAIHGLMNLWYDLFDVAETPIGSGWLIAARVAVVAIAIAATEIWLRSGRRGDG